MRKSGSTVAAAGRRMDLASLFCMIGRHGPAVALAVIAMVSVLAIVIIYRTVRGRRRKATAEAAAADSDGQSRGVEDREPSVIQPSRGELLHSSLSSTDVSDEDLSYVKEDVDLIQSDRKIRHRQAAAVAVEKKPSPYSPPKSEIQVPDPKHTALDGTEEMAVVWDYYKVSEPYVEEANQSLQSDTSTLAKMVVEKAGDCRRVATENVFEDVIEEVHDNHSCLKEPEPITEETHGQEEKVIMAECQEDVTTEKGVSDEKTRREEETPHVSESYGADGLQENTTTLETNTLESDCVENFIHIDNVPDPCISYCKDKGFEEENQDSTDNSNYSANSHLSPEERTNEGEEAEEECVDHQQTTEPDGMWSSTFEQETNMPSTQQDQCDHVPDNGTPAMQESDFGVAAEVIEELLDEEPLSTLTDIKLDADLPHFEKQDAEIIQQSESVPTCYQEDIILDNGADQEKEKILTSDNVAFGEECGSSNVAAIPALACLSIPGKDVTHDESGITINAQNVGIADFPDLSSPHQEDTISPSLEEETDCTNLGSQMPSHEIENQPESPKNNDNFTASMSEEISQPDMLASSQEVSVAADPETAENITASVTVDVSCPHLQSICQDQHSDHVENTETVDETSINSATEEPACDNASITLPLMSEETAQPDMLASSQEVSVAAYPETAENITVSVTVEVSCPHLQSICQGQQSDHVENSKTVDEASVSSASEVPACDNASITLPTMSEEISHPDMLASSQEVSVAGDPETAENITVSVTVEGVSCPHLQSICQDQQSDHMENTETFEMRVKPVSEEPACDNASITLPTMSEEMSQPDMLASSQEVSVAADPETAENITASVTTVEEVYCPHLQSICQDQQSDHVENTETVDETSIHSATEEPACDNASITLPLMSEETAHPDMLASSQEVSGAAYPETAENITASVTVEVSCPHLQSICQDQQSDHVENTETFEMRVKPVSEEPACDNASITLPTMSEEISHPDMLASSQEVSVAADPETAENITASVTVEGVSCPHLQSICQDQQSDHMENTETVDETSINSATEEPACDNASITLPLMSEETAHPDMLASSQEVSVAAYPETAENITASVTVEVSCPHLQSICQGQQSDHVENSKTVDETSVNSATEEPACDNASITLPLMSEETAHPDMLASCPEVSVAADPDTAENITVSATVEEVSCPHLQSICQDQQSDHMEITETIGEITVNSASEEPACDNASITLPIMSEEISQTDMLASCQEQTSDHKNEEMGNNFPDVTAPVTTKDITPPICQIHSLSFEQSDNAISIGVGEESGISSMAVSPDLQDAGNKLGTVENMVFSVMDYDKRPEGLIEPQNSLVADDEPISVPNEDKAGIVFGPYPQLCSKPPHNEPTDWNNLESFTANEDMLGHDIENSYHIEMDQVAAQIAASFTTFTAELKKGTDMKAVVEVLEIDDKKAANSIENKEETKAEKEEEGEYETTEINIMEATMDCNEWIEDNNSEDLPLMNLSVPLFAQDHTKNKQFPTEECSAVTDTICTDATEIPPPTEVKQTSTLSLVDENMENTKKVVAVPPMPQNVNVTFYVHYFPQSQYQMVAVTGNQQELGNWKGFIPLERAKDGHWTTVVSLPAESHVEWKFVVLDKGEVCRWEECGNRLLDTGCGDDLLVHKWWGIL